MSSICSASSSSPQLIAVRSLRSVQWVPIQYERIFIYLTSDSPGRVCQVNLSFNFHSLKLERYCLVTLQVLHNKRLTFRSQVDNFYQIYLGLASPSTVGGTGDNKPLAPVSALTIRRINWRSEKISQIRSDNILKLVKSLPFNALKWSPVTHLLTGNYKLHDIFIILTRRTDEAWKPARKKFLQCLVWGLMFNWLSHTNLIYCLDRAWAPHQRISAGSVHGVFRVYSLGLQLSCPVLR